MSISLRRPIVLGLAAMLLASFVALAAPAEATGFTQDRTYRVTVENLTEGQILTPTVVASHRASLHVFREGKEASNGIQQLAENGGVSVLVEELAGNRKVSDVIAVGDVQPIEPGASATAYLTAARNARRVSVAGMLICTNDGFGGVDSARLPRWVGDAKTFYGNAYDAGTEVNTESYADLVPPCDGLGQTGMSNADLAENGVVHGHEGIAEVGDLTVEEHGWMDPVVRITIERVRLFEVTVTNLTDTQLMTPIVFATQYGKHRVFRSGAPASNGIQQLAENGGVPVLVEELNAKHGIGTVAVIGDMPLMPGDSVSTTVEVADRARRVSVAGMLICTNDGFGGVDSARLPRWVGDAKTFYGNAYDAGTEVNTESYADLVPPCDGLGQTGMSNADLAENGVVHGHEGIMGGADLSEAQHGWMDPVFEVTVSRIG